MNSNDFKNLVILYCECIMDEDKDNPDFVKLSQKDKTFCEEYMKIYDVAFLNKHQDLSILKEWVQQYSVQYCKRNIENKKRPFSFYEATSIKMHVDEIDKFCLKDSTKVPLHSTFKNILIDLISLEYYNFQNITLQINNQIESFHSIIDEKEETKNTKRQSEMIAFQNSVNTSIKKAEKSYKKIERNIEQFQKQIYETSVTILGIFASIVLVFNASISFYSTIIDAFSNSSIYKVTFILLIVGIILTGVMMGLFAYLDSVVNKKFFESNFEEEQAPNNNASVSQNATKKKKSKKDKQKKNKSMRRVHNSLLVTLIILLLMLVGLALSWFFGLVECRNQYISKEYPQSTTAAEETTIETTHLSEVETTEVTTKTMD